MTPTKILTAVRLAAGAIPLAAVAVEAQSSASPSVVAERVERYLAPLRAAGQLSGALLLARGDTILYQGAFGWADRPGGQAMTVATPNSVASIAKPITSTVASRLIDRGLLSDTDPVAKWIPEFPVGDRITVEMLRSHRSGIPHRVTTQADEYQPRTSAEMVRLIGVAPRLFEPNARRSYSSMGYVVLARILELAAAKPYWQLVDELILRPAGTAHTYDATKPGAVSPPAAPFVLGGEGPVAHRPRDLTFLIGAGSLFSTPEDLFRIFRAFDRGDYGAAARARQVQDTTFWSGLTDYRRAYLLHQAPSRVTLVFVANLLTGAGDLILRDLPRIAQGEDLPAPAIPQFTPVAMTDAVRNQISGDYEFQQGLWTSVGFQDPKTAFAGDFLLIPTSDSTFFSMADYAEVRVLRDAERSVTVLAWGAGGPTFRKRTAARAP